MLAKNSPQLISFKKSNNSTYAIRYKNRFKNGKNKVNKEEMKEQKVKGQGLRSRSTLVKNIIFEPEKTEVADIKIDTGSSFARETRNQRRNLSPKQTNDMNHVKSNKIKFLLNCKDILKQNYRRRKFSTNQFYLHNESQEGPLMREIIYIQNQRNEELRKSQENLRSKSVTKLKNPFYNRLEGRKRSVDKLEWKNQTVSNITIDQRDRNEKGNKNIQPSMSDVKNAYEYSYSTPNPVNSKVKYMNSKYPERSNGSEVYSHSPFNNLQKNINNSDSLKMNAHHKKNSNSASKLFQKQNYKIKMSQIAGKPDNFPVMENPNDKNSRLYQFIRERINRTDQKPNLKQRLVEPQRQNLDSIHSNSALKKVNTKNKSLMSEMLANRCSLNLFCIDHCTTFTTLVGNIL
ncbi:unnamed protein product [Moneuplotes crassus]|uniref:Uncharacterized protein n=1 Tax=Euplotes crassus TaxID=5936 RepID=A0AAD1U0M6_EUPCR|nr:unnamed protein product [Moneuplotes crassus]